MTHLLTNSVECGAITPALGRTMKKQPPKKPKPKAVELSAQQLVALLIDEAGESKTSISQATGIHNSALTRFHSGQRMANESDYRKLVGMAISLKIAE